MKIVTCDGERGLGVVNDNADLALGTQDVVFHENFPTSLSAAIGVERGFLKSMFIETKERNNVTAGKNSRLKLTPPIASLSNKIICAGGNYPSHVANVKNISVDDAVKSLNEAGISGFFKIANAMVGPYDDIIMPKRTTAFDYEVELAAIIGKECKDVSRKDAPNYVFGYTILMDYSLRDLQEPKGTFNVPLKKNFDTCGAIGPSVVLAEDIPDPHNLGLKLMVNDEVRQDGNTNGMLRGVYELMEWYSRDFTLYPGDIISTGTCSGTALEKKVTTGDASWYLKPGDKVDAYVEKIGHIRNIIR